jgi:signal transduction histidine kinase
VRHEQQLSAEISHELRTPLSRILAEVDLLQSSTSPDAQTAGALRAVATSATQMDGILETLLATARSASTHAPGRCDIATAIRQALAEVDPQEGVAVTVTVSGSAGVAEPLLVRTLVPVLQNAMRFARARVDVSTEISSDGLHLLIADDGPGLGELGERAFEPGVRGDLDSDGAGLGLPLARRLARACGGDVTARPCLNGAVLDVRLPTG